VFPHGSVWEVFPSHDYLLLGTREPLRTDYAALDASLSATKALQEYADGAAGLIAYLVADAARAREAAGPGPIITDDRCFIEYTAPRSMGRDTRPQVLEWMDGLRRGTSVPSLYTGIPDRIVDEIGRRRETRRLLAEAVRIHKDDPERALATLEGVPSPLPNDPRTVRFLDFLTEDMLFKAQRRDPKGAIEVLRRVPRISSNFVPAQLLMGQIYVRAGRGEEARRCYVAAREVEPKSFDAVSGLARALQIDQNYGESAKVWKEAIELQPGLSTPHVQLAICLMRLDRIEEAKASCRKALEVDPNDRRAADLLKDLGKP